MARKLEISSAILAILFLSFLLVIALQNATASLYAVDATLQIKSWQKQNKTPTYKEWQKAHQRLHQAIKLEPKNPHNLTKIAALLQTKTKPTITTKKERNKNSLPYLRHITNLRPAWAYGWAMLALAKYRAEELDFEMRKAAINAFVSAPNDNPIRRTLKIIKQNSDSKK
ncbi:MAG: hypothetical protein HQL71_00655 [Magnetococcales bacterium]|nr:hypothetical protein [Magnetococcales bacterium]